MPVDPRSPLTAFPAAGPALRPFSAFAAPANGAEPVLIKSIRALAGRTAVWRQPSQLRQDYELVADGEIVANLRWKKNGGTTAVGRSPDGVWSLKASGYLNPRVTLRLPNSDYDFATFRPRAAGEGLLLALGDRRFEWRCTNAWQQAWAFYDHDDQRLFQIRPEGVHPRVSALVEFDPAAADHNEVGYLIVLGWYLLVLMADDAAASQPAKP